MSLLTFLFAYNNVSSNLLVDQNRPLPLRQIVMVRFSEDLGVSQRMTTLLMKFLPILDYLNIAVEQSLMKRCLQIIQCSSAF